MDIILIIIIKIRTNNMKFIESCEFQTTSANKSQNQPGKGQQTSTSGSNSGKQNKKISKISRWTPGGKRLERIGASRNR